MTKLEVGCKNFLKRNGGILLGLFFMCLVISIVNPIFLTEKNIMNVLRQISSNFFLATAMTLVLIAGGIDLSVGSIIAVIGVVDVQPPHHIHLCHLPQNHRTAGVIG